MPDLRAHVDAADRFGATLIVDDAHGGGVVGPGGRGTIAAAGLEASVPVQVGTLSKAIGAQGGYVAGSAELLDLLVQRARSFVFSTGLSPAVAGAALAGLRIAHEENDRRERLGVHSMTLRRGLREAGFEVRGADLAPMTLVLAGSPARATDWSEALEKRGVLAPAIRPPAVPVNGSRLRLAPMATHDPADIEGAVAAFRTLAANAGTP
jgi:8-amino-7-oxononanoate synthase